MPDAPAPARWSQMSPRSQKGCEVEGCFIFPSAPRDLSLFQCKRSRREGIWACGGESGGWIGEDSPGGGGGSTSVTWAGRRDPSLMCNNRDWINLGSLKAEPEKRLGAS